ncbi:MAG: ribosomal RNA small subunit methyltransferase A [bacterium]|nr:ribosomal RNA small subunit methyltransferase A [Candidatus Aquidulcis sp.]
MSPKYQKPSSRARVDGHAAKKRLSQNFLHDLNVRDQIIRAGDPHVGELVLEVGPGLGFLTEALLATGADVVAIELDTDLIPRLERRFAREMQSGQLTLVHGDALTVDLDAFISEGRLWRVIANIPYHVTSPLLHRFLLMSAPPQRIVLLVQREVAERVAAPPGDWSYLTVFVQARTRPALVSRVPREAFDPVPDVESAVLLLEQRVGSDAFPLNVHDEERLWRLVQAGFRERRKKLRNALPRALPILEHELVQALLRAGLNPDQRAQTLSVADWMRLLAQLPELDAGIPTRAARAAIARRSTGGTSVIGASPKVDGPRGSDAMVQITAHAKINLTLAVVGHRNDGYHNLHSVVAQCEVGDRLYMRPAADGADVIRLAGVPLQLDGENLCATALSALRRVCPVPAVDLVLEKRLPVAAGLGGGSSDAAATLRGAIELFGLDLSEEELLKVAAEVGSDVPLFLADSPALIEGRGEIVTPLGSFAGEPLGLLLITAGMPLRTPDVFGAYAAGLRGAGHGSALVSSQHLAAELAAGMSGEGLLQRAAALASANDLLTPARAVAPWLRPFDHALRRLLGRPLALSGSGPTLFLLYPSQREAEEGATLVANALESGELVAPGGVAPSLIATKLVVTGRGERGET